MKKYGRLFVHLTLAVLSITLPMLAFGQAVIVQNQQPDMGAQIKDALALLSGGCGEIYIAPGSYTQSTTIVIPRCVKLRGASGYGTTITYTPTTGWAVVVGDGQGISNYPEGAIEDLSLVGPGGGTTTGGIYIGGSDGQTGSPSTGIDPSGNYGDHFNINRVRDYGFGTGVQWGNNAWANTIFESTITNDGIGLYFPPSLTNSGENVSLVNSKVQNWGSIGLKLGVYSTTQLDFYCVNTEFDNFTNNESWAVQNGTSSSGVLLTMTGCHVETVDHWLQNYGYTFLFGDTFTNGTNSSTLGYLIDNESQNMTVSGGAYLNSGSGGILNPSGTCSTWLGVTASGNITPTCATIDKFGDIVGTNVAGKMVTANQGTAQTTGNLFLGTGWGTGASAALAGPSSQYTAYNEFTITSGSGSFASAPTVAVNFPTTWPSAPVCSMTVSGIAGSGGAIIFKQTAQSTTSTTFTATTSTGSPFTPGLTETYTVVMHCGL
jgi:hypothetical protein